MQRVIKFRIWSPKDQTLRSLPESKPMFTYFGDVGILSVDGNPQNSFWEYEDAVIQQFTGLFDKNGKEIYEGDIVKYDSGSEYENEEYKKLLTSEVFYENGKYRIRYSADSYNWRKMEVIGNIFENKEAKTNF